VFDAVSKGSVQAAHTTTGFAAGKIPHMIFFSSVPFGPKVNEYVAWIQRGGGYQLKLAAASVAYDAEGWWPEFKAFIRR
jgi:TRAP-type mannitol/chloroaromatic compound transport system substrate-binding protein